ncbi:MAG: hypothetical protein QXL94_05620 [Candidatus Parvarchaeum sp.]
MKLDITLKGKEDLFQSKFLKVDDNIYRARDLEWCGIQFKTIAVMFTNSIRVNVVMSEANLYREPIVKSFENVLEVILTKTRAQLIAMRVKDEIEKKVLKTVFDSEVKS